MKDSPPGLADFLELFAAMPPRQTTLFIAFAVFSIVAGNGVFALHYRRVGKPVLKSILNPASFPILNFNRLEWILLVSSLAISMAIGIAAARSG